MTALEEVLTLLNATGATVIYGEPADLALAEGIVVRESERRQAAQADGAEWLTEDEFTLNVYAASPERAGALADAADAALRAAGFVRSARAEGADGRYRRVLARYRVRLDGRGAKWH